MLLNLLNFPHSHIHTHKHKCKKIDTSNTMPKQLQKSLSDYLSKRKNKSTPQPPPNSTHKTLSSSTSWLLRGCRHPKTPSFSAVDHKEKQAQGENDAATLADVDRFLFENFKSFYSKDDDTEVEANTNKKTSNNNIMKKGKKEEIIAPKNDEIARGLNSLTVSPRYVIPSSNLTGSRRFFVAPGSSSSLIEEARTSMTVSEDTGSTSAITTTTNTNSNESSAISVDNSKETLNADDFITLIMYSPSPYDDFRRSMHEIMEARLNDQGKINWEFMEELLFCYLNLNDKKSYKYILSAFVDQIVVLRENSGRVPEISRNVRQLDGELNQRNT